MNNTLNNSCQRRTLASLLETSCRLFGPQPALAYAMQKPITYTELFDQVIKLAGYLFHLGVRKGDHVAILAESSPNWGIAYLATVRLGAVAVPILPDFTGPDVKNILLETDVRILFTSKRHLKKIYELNSYHPLTRIITLDESKEDGSTLYIEPFSVVLNQGAALTDSKTETTGVNEDDMASLIYTSGTTGHSKAVMLTHGNLIANVESANQIIKVPAKATFLSLLPLSHTYEFTLGFLLPLINGAKIAYIGKTPTPTLLEKICRYEKPTAICAVPMIMEKIYKKKVASTIAANPALKLAAAIPGLKDLLFKKIGQKLLDFFGGNLTVVAIGGAPLLHEVEEFLAAAEFPYIIGYGLTETSPLLAAGPFGDKTITIGSTGKPVPGVSIRLANPDPKTGIGEILARGANIMKGYYKKQELTAGTIDKNGWLATGDLGFFDKQGNLHLTGRIKNVIVLAHGENIYPEIIEDKINSSLHVAESLVVAQNGRLVAHVYLDQDQLSQEIIKKSPDAKTRYIEELLKTIHKNVNRQLPAYSQISSILERREPFLKTATQKIKRHLYTM